MTTTTLAAYVGYQAASARQANTIKECVKNLHPETVNPVNICLNLQQLFDPLPSTEMLWLGRLTIIAFFLGIGICLYHMRKTGNDIFEWILLPTLSAITAALVPVLLYGLFCAVRFFFF